MVGYDSITPVAPRVADTPPPSSEERLFLREVRVMTAAQGFTEVSNYSFVNEDQMCAFGFRIEDHIAVTNPISSEQGFLRTSLLPGIRKNLLDNSRHLDSFRLFEIGREIHKQPAGLPREIPHLAAAICTKEDSDAGLFELKRLAECLLPGAEVRPALARSFEHPARTFEVLWQGAVTGQLFEFHPVLVAGRASVLDIDLALVRSLRPREKRYRQIRRFPSSAFDLSVVAGIRELAGDIGKKLAALAGEHLESIEFVRQYSGPPLPEGVKSVSFRLTVGAAERTLSAEEISSIRNEVIEGMRQQGYELRL
jgi:phenylalanyl-tRNA synthetase beta chain